MSELESSLYSKTLDIPIEQAMAECDELHVVLTGKSNPDDTLVITGEQGNLLCEYNGEQYTNSSALTVMDLVLDVLDQAGKTIDVIGSEDELYCIGYLRGEYEDDFFADPSDSIEDYSADLLDEEE